MSGMEHLFSLDIIIIYVCVNVGVIFLYSLF